MELCIILKQIHNKKAKETQSPLRMTLASADSPICSLKFECPIDKEKQRRLRILFAKAYFINRARNRRH